MDRCRIYLRDKKTELADGLKVEGETEEGIKTDSVSFLYQQVRRQGWAFTEKGLKIKMIKGKKPKKKRRKITQKDTGMRGKARHPSVSPFTHPQMSHDCSSSDTPWSLCRTQAQREGCSLFTVHPPHPEDPHRHPQVHEMLPSTFTLSFPMICLQEEKTSVQGG